MSKNNRNRSLIFLILCGLHLLSISVFAADKVLDASQLDQMSVSLTEYFAVLEDPSLTLTLADVQRPDVAACFKTGFPPGESLNFSYTSSAYWLRLHLKNSGDKPIERMLEIAHSLLSSIKFYQPVENQGYQIINTGYSRPFSERLHKSRFFVLPVSMPAYADQVVYLRIETPNMLSIPARLWESKAFYAHERNDYLTQALYFGMVISMLLFNLLLFIILRDFSYLLYVIFVGCMALSFADFMGIGSEFLWGDSPVLTKIGVNIGASVAFVALLLFMRRVLATATLAPKLDRLLKLFVGVNTVLPILLVLSFQHVVKLAVICHVITNFLMLVTGVICALTRQRSAYFFVVAFSMLFLTIIIASLRALDILPTNAFTTTAPQFGTALEMLLLAFALADRYNVILREKEKAQREALEAQQLLVENLKSSERVLEARVTERTAELQIFNRKLEALSTTDGLTGIANRRRFDEVLVSEWSRAARLGQPLALAMLDVDWFKKYNDHYGHQAGDECLQNIAGILSANICRTGDLVARYGGEEFVFIAPATDGVIALNMARKVCVAIQTLALPHEMSGFGSVTTSIGVAAIVPEEGLVPDILVKAADEALYCAKKQGRNRAVLAITGDSTD